MFFYAFLVCIDCKNTLPCGGNKEYLSIYLSIYLPRSDYSLFELEALEYLDSQQKHTTLVCKWHFKQLFCLSIFSAIESKKNEMLFF